MYRAVTLDRKQKHRLGSIRENEDKAGLEIKF